MSDLSSLGLERKNCVELLKPSQLEAMIEFPSGSAAQKLRKLADSVRSRTVGPEVHLRGLLEFSSFCRNNCCYCGLRRDNHKLSRYRMTPREIIRAATEGARLGYKTIVLQSGEDPAFTGEILAKIIGEIKQLGLVVTLSVGEREPGDYELWRRAGAERYLMRHETADSQLYQRLHPGQTLEKRVALLKVLKELDYQVGTGFIVGLPGQSARTLLADLDLVRELQAEMVGIGPLIPHPDTPLWGHPGGTAELTCLMLGLTRLIVPYALIPATTALGTIDPQGREKALQSGANVIMPNLTPIIHRNEYQIYPGKLCTGDEAAERRESLLRRITGMGRVVGTDPGHNLLWLKRRKQEKNPKT